MNIRSTLVVYRKELKDILRDRRTLMSMVLFPILIIPVFYIGLGAVMYKRMESLAEKRSTVVWIDSGQTDDLLRSAEQTPGVDILSTIPDTAVALDMLREKEVDAVVQIPPGFNGSLAGVISGDEQAELPAIQVYVDETRQTSEFAAGKITGALSTHRSNLVSEVLTSRGMRPEMVEPYRIEEHNIASPEQMGRFVTGFFLPYIVILMILTGAMYPAIDLTAGEKERGTLETLLVSGVARSDIVFGKFFTVVTASIVTATLTLSSIAFTFTQGIKFFGELKGLIHLEFDLSVLALLLLTMIPLSVIFSALLMTLSLFAKSYREAQSYISPLMILVVIPAMASMIPDVELTHRMAFIPVVNVSLLLKDGLAGNIDYGALTITMLVNFVLAGFALFLVQKMFQRESVLFRI